MTRPILYIAGPFSAPTMIGIERNILNAKEAAEAAIYAGWFPFCPHMNTAGFQHLLGVPDEVWYEGDLKILNACADALCHIAGWHKSYGAQKEIFAAHKKRIPIFDWDRGGHMMTPNEVLL